MIICGYQGIGKTTLSKVNKTYIDLESSNYWFLNNDGKNERLLDWYELYINMAEDMSRKGYAVFVSCHKEVRDRLLNSSEDVRVIIPSLGLKDKWIERLKSRYDETKLEKDYKAYVNTVYNYDQNIADIMSSGLECIIITNIDYDLNKAFDDNLDEKYFKLIKREDKGE